MEINLNIAGYLREMDLQRKLFIVLGTIILVLLATLIFGISTYEEPIQNVIEEFISASENLNLSKLLRITTGVLHENIVKQRETVESIKQKVHFKGYLQNYKVKFLDKRPEMAKVQIIPEITESYAGKSSITYEHTIIIDVIKINNEWKISNIKVVETNITG